MAWRRSRPGLAQKGSRGPGPIQEERKGRAGPDPRGEDGKAHNHYSPYVSKLEFSWHTTGFQNLKFEKLKIIIENVPFAKIGVGSSGWGRPSWSGLVLPPWDRGWPALHGYNFHVSYNHILTIFRGWRKKEDRSWPFSGLGLVLPSLGLKLALRGGVGPSFLGSGLALRVGVGPSILRSALASFVRL